MSYSKIQELSFIKWGVIRKAIVKAHRESEYAHKKIKRIDKNPIDIYACNTTSLGEGCLDFGDVSVDYAIELGCGGTAKAKVNLSFTLNRERKSATPEIKVSVQNRYNLV